MLDMYPYMPAPAYKASGSQPKPKPHPISYQAPSSAVYTPLPPSLAYTQASSSRSIASAPITPIFHPSSSASYSTGKRPKLAKKAASSTAAKQRGVQASLEAQVDKCRGWQAFFMPVKPMPVVPPCSPVLGASRAAGQEVDMDGGDDSDLSRSTSNSSHHQQQCPMGLPSGFGTEAMQLQQMAQAVKDRSMAEDSQREAKERDYFGQWAPKERWVEDVDVEAMELDE